MPETFRIARFVYLRLLAVCLGAGFAALWHQAPGLIGSRGLTPLADMLDGWTKAHGEAAFWRAPSLFWWSSSDAFVAAVALVGLAASGFLLVGIAPRLSCVVGYVAWLSFRAVDGGPVCWFNYPYDDLQTEALFLGMLVSPGALWPGRAAPDVPRWVRVLLVWCLFRLLFGPGITKVLFHEPWRDLTAVGDFLLTMPHPTPAAAWFRELPPRLLQGMTAFTLACELLCPFLFFVPGRPRRFAAVACIALMVGIQLVCNIRGFNLLTIGLLLFLWDDRSLLRLLPERWRREAPTAQAPAARASTTSRFAAATVATLGLAASAEPFLSQFGWSLRTIAPAAAAERALAPFRLASCYTMFCVVPPERPGLVVQGSQDGTSWHDYELPGTPSRVDRAPRFLAPYHDYLGFRLWFAAFCPTTMDDWLRVLQQRLLAGEPTVRKLFSATPFGGAPPAAVRILWVRFDYAQNQQRAAGTFWTRELLGVRVAPARRDG